MILLPFIASMPFFMECICNYFSQMPFLVIVSQHRSQPLLRGRSSLELRMNSQVRSSMFCSSQTLCVNKKKLLMICKRSKSICLEIFIQKIINLQICLVWHILQISNLKTWHTTLRSVFICFLLIGFRFCARFYCFSLAVRVHDCLLAAFSNYSYSPQF